jgi:hypothetical protein
VRLSASQVIQRPPTEVFRFVATEHFQNHPKWDPAVTSITQTSPGPMGSERPRGWSGPTGAGGSKAASRSPSTSRSAASPRCPDWPVHAARSGDVGARRAVEHQTGAGDQYPRPWGDPVAAAVDEGNLRQDDGPEPSQHQAAGGSDRLAHDLTHLETKKELPGAGGGPSGGRHLRYVGAERPAHSG